jgi:hypothetical protein
MFGESEKEEASRSVETVSRCLESLRRRRHPDLWKRFPEEQMRAE